MFMESRLCERRVAERTIPHVLKHAAALPVVETRYNFFHTAMKSAVGTQVASVGVWYFWSKKNLVGRNKMIKSAKKQMSYLVFSCISSSFHARHVQSHLELDV